MVSIEIVLVIQRKMHHSFFVGVLFNNEDDVNLAEVVNDVVDADQQ